MKNERMLVMSFPEIIWRHRVNTADLADCHTETLPGALGIRVVEVGAASVRAEVPVVKRHIQPQGILHGGEGVVLAETVGSSCGTMVSPEGHTCGGPGLNASHLAPVWDGDLVTAECRPPQLGRSVKVWQIETRRQDETLTCISRLTTALRQVR